MLLSCFVSRFFFYFLSDDQPISGRLFLQADQFLLSLLCPSSALRSCSLLDLQIWSVYLICSSTFHCQLIVMALTRKPCEIDFRYEKWKLSFDMRPCSEEEVQNQKDEVTARVDERVQKVSDFRVRLEAARAPSNVRSVTAYRDATEGKAAPGAGVIWMPKRLKDKRVTMVSLAAWASAGSNGRSLKEVATQWGENAGHEAAGIDEGSAESD
jgi:hypothetical protein